MTTATDALAQVLAAAGRPLTPDDDVRITGADPVLATDFMAGTAAAAALAALGLAASDLWKLRTGRSQNVEVDALPAALSLRGDRYLRINGRAPESPWGGISGFYETKDGRWVQYHCNYPHHRDGVLKLLGVGDDREQVAAATRKHDAAWLEDELAAMGMCAGIVRTRAEWEAHPQGRAVAASPLLEVLRIGDSPSRPLPPGERPLAGVRVLDLTRVLAGPAAGRSLAEYGADVLKITAPHLPAQPDVDIETGHGKLSAQLDLRRERDAARLLDLAATADVFLQSYRPGTLTERGFSPEALAERNPGLIYLTLSAYGHEGPWSGRRGFDTLVQSTTGIVHEHSAGGPPRHLPCSALDYLSGYLLALGAMVALRRRAEEGGSYLVRVSLAQTGHWFWELGRVQGRAREEPGLDDLAPYLVEDDSPFGRLRHLGPVVRMSETPPRWERPSVPLGYHPAEWP